LEAIVPDVVEKLNEKKVNLWRKGLQGWKMSDEVLLQSFVNGLLDQITHLDMIRMIYLHIIQGWERGDRGTVAVTQIVDDFETYWRKNKDKAVENIPDITKRESMEAIKANILASRFNSCYSGITHLHFWIQMVSACLTKATHFRHEALKGFNEFITCFPELLWDRLWNNFYSHGVCFAHESRAMVVPADVNSLPAFIKK